MLIQYVDKQLPYDNITQLRERMADVAPHLVKNDTVESPMWLNGEYFKVHFTCVSVATIGDLHLHDPKLRIIFSSDVRSLT